jgi:hypothetical protein
MDARLEGAQLPDERLDPAWVAPMVAYLASPACTVNGEAISAIYGRYARVFAGVGRGWASPGPSTPTPDDIVARWAEIERLDDYLLPDDVFDEVHAVAARDRAR